MQSYSVLVKTAKGLEEIDKRSHKLAGRLRAILFMIDGQKTLGQLLEQAGDMGEQLETQIAELAEQGFIAAIADDFPPDGNDDEGAARSGDVVKPTLREASQASPAKQTSAAVAPPARPIPVAATPPQPAPIVLSIEESKKRIGAMLTETMGMRAMFLSAQLENVRSRDELGGFIDDTARSVAVSNGGKVGDQWRARARSLVGL